jgi:hypothetical protein
MAARFAADFFACIFSIATPRARVFLRS